jgi:hypothetical protein
MMKRDFFVRIPARFLKDDLISADAKALRALIGAFADGKTGKSHVTGGKLQRTLHWGRRRRERAQGELVRMGWLRLNWKRGERGKYARRIYVLADPIRTVAQFGRSGESALLISDHSQSQVRSSIPTDFTNSETHPESFRSDLT